MPSIVKDFQGYSYDVVLKADMVTLLPHNPVKEVAQMPCYTFTHLCFDGFYTEVAGC